MKVVVFSCLFLVFAGMASAQDWNQQTVDNSGNVGKYTAIAHDSNGNPHITYLDETNRRYMYTYYDNAVGAWHKEVLFEFETTYCRLTDSLCDITIDSNDVVLIVAQYSSQSYYRYLYLYSGAAGGTLTRSTIQGGYDSSSPPVGFDENNFINPSIYATASMRCVTVFDDRSDVFRFFRWSGSSWQEEEVDITINAGRHSDVTISPAGNTYCTYDIVSMIHLAFQNDQGAWFSMPLEQDASHDVYSSIAVDQNEDIHIAYRDINAGLKHATVTRAKLMLYAASRGEVVEKPSQISVGQ